MPSPPPSVCDAPAGGLLGRVVIDGAPAPRPVRVTVASSCATFTELTRAGGRFSLSSLPQGTYVLMASIGTEAAVISEVTIAAGAVVAVDLELGAEDVARAAAAMDRRSECGCSS